MTLLRKRRVLLVLLAAAVVGTGITGFVAYRMHTIRHGFLVARDMGFAEYQKGDYAGATRDLNTYLGRFPSDTAALRAFAESRLKVEEPDGSQIPLAINAYRRLMDLGSDTPEMRHKLVDLFMKAGLNTECVQLADKLLAVDPHDAPVLHNKAMSLFQLRKYDDAAKVNAVYCAVKPDDFEARVVQLELLRHVGPPAPDIVGQVDKARAARPDDVRLILLESIACAMVGDGDGARKWARATASHKAAEAKVASFQTQQLWNTGETALGDAVLSDAVMTFKDATLQGLWAKRLYQLARYDELVKLTPVDPTNAAVRAAIGGYQCLAYIALQDMDKARAARAALAADGQSIAARDWAEMLQYSIDPESGTASSRARGIKDLAGRHPEIAYFQMMQAAVTQAAGDFNTTLRTWNAVARAEPAWATPVVRMAEVFIATNRFAEALAASRVAVARAPGDRDALVALALATNGAGNAADDGQALATMLDQIRQKFPDEKRIMALRVSLKAKLQGRDAGAAALQQVLALQPAAPLPVLLQLLSISHTQNLGEDDACLAAAEKAYGMVPDVAFAKAALMAEQGHTPEGAALLKDLRAKATSDPEAWDLAYARYLEAAHDPAAHDLWLSISEKYSDDQRAQWLALNSPSIQGDHAAAGKVIERLQPLMGETDFNYKLARAQWLLAGTPGATAISQASDLLSDMTKAQPDVLAPQLLLAECLQRNGNISGAIDHLEIAARLAPENVPIAINLAQLLQSQGQQERANPYITKVAARGDLNALQLRQVALLLGRQGNYTRAAALMEAGAAKYPDDTENRLLLAALEAQLGQNDKAAALFDALVKQPTLPIIRAAAAFYASHDRTEQAKTALAALHNLKLDPGVIATEMGDFATRFGRPAEVLAAYTEGLKEAPANAQIWYRLIGFHLQNGNVADAEKAIDQAAAALPNDAVIASLTAKKHAIETLSGDTRCRPMLLSLITAPQFSEAATAVLARLEKSGGTTAPDPQLGVDLSRLADRYPQYAALQNLAVEVNVLMNRTDDAVNIAVRAMQTFPTAAEPARLASAAFAASSRWSETLGASNQWRTRSADQTLAPDVMIGASYLGLGRPDDALRQIQPYMEEAATDPDNYGAAIVIYARSELAKNRPDNAQAKLWPFAKSSKRGMVAFLQIAGHEAPTDTGKQWLAMARPELRNDLDLEYVYATAAVELAARANDSGPVLTAIDELSHAVAAGNRDPVKLSLGYLSLGMLQENQSQVAQAEAAYRKAIELNPKCDPACNNLAMILARSGRLPEALNFASQAVELAPKVAPYQDTLAFVQDKAGDHKGAIDHLRTAMALQPTNVEWRINLAQVYLNAGQKDQAKSTLATGVPIAAEQLAPDLQSRFATLTKSLGVH